MKAQSDLFGGVASARPPRPRRAALDADMRAAVNQAWDRPSVHPDASL